MHVSIELTLQNILRRENMIFEMPRDVVTEVFGVGERMLDGTDIAVYAFIMMLDRLGTGGAFIAQQAVVAEGGWLNHAYAIEQGFNKTSRAPMVAPWKAGELLAYTGGAKQEGMLCTPVLLEPHQRGTGWAGGVAFGDAIIGVSKLAEAQDKFFAAILAYAAADSAFGLHHMGKRFSDVNGFDAALQSWKLADPTDEIWQPAYPGQVRAFKEVGLNRNSDGYFHEIQCVEGDPTPGYHWDFFASDPHHFLSLVAAVFGLQPNFWSYESHEPVGEFWLPQINGQPALGIMARQEGTNWHPADAV